MGFRENLQAQGSGGALFNPHGAQVVGVTALLAAVDSGEVQAGITLVADHLVTTVLLGELCELKEGGLNDTTLQTKHQVQGARFLNVVV